MTDIGKLLILLGVLIAMIGVVIWAAGRLGFHGLPGDVRYQGSHVQIYFPIVTCIVLSVILTLAMWIWRWFQR
jgi:hypothetical protein